MFKPYCITTVEVWCPSIFYSIMVISIKIVYKLTVPLQIILKEALAETVFTYFFFFFIKIGFYNGNVRLNAHTSVVVDKGFCQGRAGKAFFPHDADAIIVIALYRRTNRVTAKRTRFIVPISCVLGKCPQRRIIICRPYQRLWQ